MEWTLKVMANLLDDDEKGIGEATYAALAALVRPLPIRYPPVPRLACNAVDIVPCVARRF